MSFDLTLIRSDRTDMRPLHLSVPVWAVWAGVVFIAALPFLVAALGAFVFAPSYISAERQKLNEQISTLEAQVAEFGDGGKKAEEELARVSQDLQKERELRAAAEAKIAITESARTENLQRVQELEEKNTELEKGLEFYEAFIRPASDRSLMQCYNITTDYKSGKLNYGVNFLRTDRKAKDAIPVTVKFRVLAGGAVLEMGETGSEADHTRELKIKEAHRINGSISVSAPENSLRILDIKAYDSNDQVAAHCWKAF